LSATEHQANARLRAEREAVETFYRAFSEREPDLVDTVLTPDWQDIPMAPGQAAGPEGIKAIIRMLGEALPDLRITIPDTVQEPGKIAVRGEITGTHEGPLFGIAATGKQVSFRLYEFHTLQKGRVATTWHMEDWFGLFLQLGQFPAQA
jgi:predicted ester cyclase